MKFDHIDKTIRKNTLSEDWPRDGLESMEVCPICHSRQREMLYTDLRDRIFFCAPGSWTMYQCSKCGSGYLDPRPTEETISLAYQSYFTHESNKDNPKGSKWIRRILGNGYRNWKFGTKSRPSTIFGYFLILMIPKERRKIDAAMRHIPKHHENKKLLDFGCGNGEFLEQAKSAEWSVKGLDFDLKAVEVAQKKGLNVSHGGIDELAEMNETFSLITLSHVIEHVHNPQKLIQTCYEKLEPGGRLWIETPNLNAQGHCLYKQNWRDLDPPRHLTIFTTESLSHLIFECGFSKVVIEQENPVIDLVFGSSESISHGEDPLKSAENFINKKRCEWNSFKKKATKNPFLREFITLSASK